MQPTLRRADSNLDYLQLWQDLQESAGGNITDDPFALLDVVPAAQPPPKRPRSEVIPAERRPYMPPTDPSTGAPYVSVKITQGNRAVDAANLWIRSNSRSSWACVTVDCASEAQADQIERMAKSDPTASPDEGIELKFVLIYDDAHKAPVDKHKKGKHCDMITIQTRQGSEKSADTIPLPLSNEFGFHTQKGVRSAQCNYDPKKHELAWDVPEFFSLHEYVEVKRPQDITHRVEFSFKPVSYTHLRAHETPEHLVCRLLLEKKKKKNIKE
eukprot:TRINITY_DN14364_c0_g2_i1.p1 TRINITY_DN14364_c0_g2~~TRINITY_DN14364_c0_g2_i1.p1  ORF type:complete len:270 (-),score=79.56 TRINITY_DN14364_c0_g2_i1:101-910(-)